MKINNSNSVRMFRYKRSHMPKSGIQCLHYFCVKSTDRDRYYYTIVTILQQTTGINMHMREMIMAQNTVITIQPNV